MSSNKKEFHFKTTKVEIQPEDDQLNLQEDLTKKKNEQITVNHTDGILISPIQSSLVEHLIHKRGFLTKMKQELKSVSSTDQKELSRQHVIRLNKLVDKEDKMEEDWAFFYRYFQQIHPNFQERLINLYPNLREKDIKLCCLLRMDLSTKEMAPLLNISTRGTEISRYRLRKKLALNNKTILVDFINKI